MLGLKSQKMTAPRDYSTKPCYVGTFLQSSCHFSLPSFIFLHFLPKMLQQLTFLLSEYNLVPYNEVEREKKLN